MATQGDAKRNNWVTSYLIRYGYDGKTWISYGAGQVNLQHVFIYLFEFASVNFLVFLLAAWSKVFRKALFNLMK